MPKSIKKKLRKIKDRLIHAANEMREDPSLDAIRDHLINVINDLQTHINERGVSDD